MTHDDFQFEPLPGLPSHLPKGEEILWQGRPSIWGFARDVLLLRWVAGYFLFLIIWRGIANSDQGLAVVLQNTMPLIVFGCLASAVLMLIAWIIAGTTVYTITSARVVIRKGAALSFTLNLPFTKILSADMTERTDRSGTIVLTTADPVGLSYLMLWPHVRPWKMRDVCPSLRSIKDVRDVSDILANAAVGFTRKSSDARVETGVMAQPVATPAE
ncbi:MAG: photosynthetic complex putative assembly protein PuhB [Pseudomonadota bacterium]